MPCSCHNGQFLTSDEWLAHFEEEDRDAELHLSKMDAQALKAEHDRFRAILKSGKQLHPSEMAGHAMWEESLRRIR